MKAEEKDKKKWEDIAIVGLSHRVPKSQDLNEFFSTMKNGNDLSTLEDNYARYTLDDIDKWDADFFNTSPKDANIMDPQHRIMLECAWEALETSGYDPYRYPDQIGVFATCNIGTYLIYHLLPNYQPLSAASYDELMMGNDKDKLSTRISYHLNLKGPSFNIQSACSSSFAALYTACQSLINGDCSMAISGAISLRIPQNLKYEIQQGGMYSSDGKCRSFDKDAEGFSFGDGAAVLVLKKLEEALKHQDHILGVIKGMAINNDGRGKLNYYASSISGQERVIREAMETAGVPERSIKYIETHGSGTSLGDSVEIKALQKVFAESSVDEKFCALGSVKSNLGHLDVASGIMGLVKTLLVLKNRVIPPLCHFNSLRSNINLDETPFYINKVAVDWHEDENFPRRAGVSSFGVGGTNVHAIVEEAPQLGQLSANAVDQYQLFLISAQTEEGVKEYAKKLIQYFKGSKNVPLKDIAGTLMHGRRQFDYRVGIPAKNERELLEQLSTEDYCVRFTNIKKEIAKKVVFIFPGVGDQFVDMSKGLYLQFPHYKEKMDFCASFLKAEFNYDLMAVLFPPKKSKKKEPNSNFRDMIFRSKNESLEEIDCSANAQISMFVVEYCISSLLIEVGVVPHTILGYSTGEIVAACIAKVMSLEEGLKMMYLRSQLVESLPEGRMMAVPIDCDRLDQYLLNTDVCVAAENGMNYFVLSGTKDSILKLREKLDKDGVYSVMVKTDAAFHSPVMEPLVMSIKETLSDIKFKAPVFDFWSSISGDKMTVEQATSVQYWAEHIRKPVRFKDAAIQLLNKDDKVYVEIGGGRLMNGLIAQLETSLSVLSCSPIASQYDRKHDGYYFLKTIGDLWSCGQNIDWGKLLQINSFFKTPLPTYHFKRKSYWVESKQSAPSDAFYHVIESHKEKTFFQETWTGVDYRTEKRARSDEEKVIVIFLPVVSKLREELRRLAESLDKVFPVFVEMAQSFSVSKNTYRMDGDREEDFKLLLTDIMVKYEAPVSMIYTWGCDLKTDMIDVQDAFCQYKKNCFRMVNLFKVCYRHFKNVPLNVILLTDQIHHVLGSENLNILSAPLFSLSLTIKQEYRNIRCKNIDIKLDDLCGRLLEKACLYTLEEARDFVSESIVALRGGKLWRKNFIKLPMNANLKTGELWSKDKGVIVIIGGLGRVGAKIAHHLIERYSCQVVLVGRTSLLDMEKSNNERIKMFETLKKLDLHLEYKEVDIANLECCQQMFESLKSKYGKIRGMIHAAGYLDEDSMCPIEKMSLNDFDRHSAAKFFGTHYLCKLLDKYEVDFCFYMSSVSSHISGENMLAYSSSNLFMDNYIRSHSCHKNCQHILINWDGWDTSNRKHRFSQNPITISEGVFAMEHAWREQLSHVSYCSTDFRERLDLFSNAVGVEVSGSDVARHLKDVSEESRLENLWQSFFRIEKIDRHKDFLELGGDSFLALQLVAKINKEFNVNLTMSDFFEEPTIHGVVQKIS